VSIHASIYHLTHYRYDRPVILGPQIIRLRPAAHSRTRVISHSLKVSPSGHFVNHQQDPYGNWLARFVFPEPVRELKIEVDLVADMSVYNPFDFFVEESAEKWPFEYAADLEPDLVIYRKPEPAGPHLQGVPRHHPAQAHAHGRLHRVPERAHAANEIGYVIRMEPGVQTPEETLEAGTGSCRDSTWLLVQAAAPPGPRRALRVGLPDPAEARREAAGWSAGHRPRLHRPARLVRGLPAGRRLGRARPDLRPADRRGPHPARRDAPLPHAAPDRRLVSEAEVEFGFDMKVTPRRRARRASPSPSPRELGRALTSWARRWTRR
jgi:hypothetical protein